METIISIKHEVIFTIVEGQYEKDINLSKNI
jgi:hypothetical protein